MRNKRGWARGLPQAVLLTMAFATSMPLVGAERLLVLHSSHKSPWTDEVCRGIQSVLRQRPEFDPSIEYMDTKRINTPDYLRELTHIYEAKYSNDTFDVVITVDNDALDYAIAHHATFLGNAPIVFCGVNGYSPDMLRGDRNITGVVEQGDFRQTLEAALALCPDTKRLLVIADDTTTSKINVRELEAVVTHHFRELEMDVTGDLTIDELRARLTTLPPDTLPFFISFWHDGSGKTILPGVLEVVFRASARPVFGRSEWMIDRGLCGGKCVIGFNQGQRAAKFAAKILDGVPVADLPVDEQSPNAFIFDYADLLTHGLNPKRLPAGSRIVNAPKGFYAVPKPLLAVLIVLLASLAGMVLALGASVRRRMVAERQLRTSMQRVRDLVETTADVIWETDARGRYSYVSPRVTDLLGYQPDELVGREPANALQTKDARRLCHPMTPTDGKTEPFDSVVSEVVTRSGKPALISCSAVPYYDGKGVFLGYRGTSRDVTRIHHAEEMLRMTQHVLDHAVDAVLWLDKNGRVTYANETASSWLGYSRDELESMAIDQLDASFTGDVWDEWWKKLCEKPADSFETDYQRRDGKEIPVEIVASFVRFEGQARACLFVRNISERRHFEDQLRQSQKMESIGMLAGGIAHDFNNMLGGIIGAAELMQLDLKDDEAHMEHLAIILQAAQTAAQMTRQLLAFSRKGSVVYEPFDAHGVIGAALAIVRHSVDRRIQVIDHLDATRKVVKGDAALLQNAIMNLCINARDAMPEGGNLSVTTRNVTLGAADCDRAPFRLRPGTFIQLEISDTGIGMPPDIVERIFEPFFSTKEAGRGTGLGLPAVYGTVLDMQGAIRVKTEPGKGTACTIDLPLAGIIGEEEFSNKPKPAEKRATDGGGLVLVVDDEQAMRDVLSIALSRAGFEVLTANDGREAVEIYTQEMDRIQVVILDMLMPRMNGQECFRELCKLNPDVRVVVQSGFSFEKELDAMFKQGISGFLRKPYKLTDIVDAVKKARKPGANDSPPSTYA